VLISAGAGLSASAGLDYTSETVFKEKFPVMHQRGFRTMYEFIGFRDWTDDLKWGYLFSQINLARFTWGESEVYQKVKTLCEQGLDQDGFFVITSNADGMFGQNGFHTERVYTPQGDYGRMQCLKKCTGSSYWPTKPFLDAALPKINAKTQELNDHSLFPRCKNCGADMFMNVRGGDWFMEEPNLAARQAYLQWLQRRLEKIEREKSGKFLVILEIGAGFNTPSVLRWPNESLAEESESVRLIRLNLSHPEVPEDIENVRAVGIDSDALVALKELL